jgi:hypothetical protein
MSGPLFKPFRALGYITEDAPFAIQRRGKQTYVTVSVGKTWQVGDAGETAAAMHLHHHQQQQQLEMEAFLSGSCQATSNTRWTF